MSILTLAFVVVVAIVAAFLMSRTAKAFVPDEDQGLFFVNVQLPPAASLERTRPRAGAVEDILWETRASSPSTRSAASPSSTTRSARTASFFVRLRPWHERKDADLSAFAILEVLKRRLGAELPEAVAFPFLPRRSRASARPAASRLPPGPQRHA